MFKNLSLNFSGTDEPDNQDLFSQSSDDGLRFCDFDATSDLLSISSDDQSMMEFEPLDQSREDDGPANNDVQQPRGTSKLKILCNALQIFPKLQFEVFSLSIICAYFISWKLDT